MLSLLLNSLLYTIIQRRAPSISCSAAVWGQNTAAAAVRPRFETCCQFHIDLYNIIQKSGADNSITQLARAIIMKFYSNRWSLNNSWVHENFFDFDNKIIWISWYFHFKYWFLPKVLKPRFCFFILRRRFALKNRGGARLCYDVLQGKKIVKS